MKAQQLMLLYDKAAVAAAIRVIVITAAALGMHVAVLMYTVSTLLLQ
jgi:hypothetical protein